MDIAHENAGVVLIAFDCAGGQSAFVGEPVDPRRQRFCDRGLDWQTDHSLSPESLITLASTMRARNENNSVPCPGRKVPSRDPSAMIPDGIAMPGLMRAKAADLTRPAALPIPRIAIGAPVCRARSANRLQ